MGGRGSSSGLGRVSKAKIAAMSDTELKDYATKASRDFSALEKDLKKVNSERMHYYDQVKDLKRWAKKDPKYTARLEKTEDALESAKKHWAKISPKARKAEKNYNLARNEWFKRYPKKSFLD